MKFSTTSLAAVLTLCATSSYTHAFTSPSLQRTNAAQPQNSAFGVVGKNRKNEKFQPLNLNTLEKEETETKAETESEVIAANNNNDNNNDNDADDALVVSATHVFMNGRIVEGGLIKEKPIVVLEEDPQQKPLRMNVNDDAPDSSSNDLNDLNSHDINTITPTQSSPSPSPSHRKTPESVAGIKMASAATSSLEELKTKEANKPKSEMPTYESESKKMEESPSQIDLDLEEASGASFSNRLTNSGVASAAAMATAAVNAAVSMKTLQAPDVSKSYISLDTTKELDGDGLPLVYDKDAIEEYWKKEKGALNKRWGYFVGKAVPFLTRLTTLFIKDGKIDERYIPELSEKARIDLQDLGPTFIKAGQMMSVRPDVLPQVSN
jgi:hypothetical protein